MILIKRWNKNSMKVKTFIITLLTIILFAVLFYQIPWQIFAKHNEEIQEKKIGFDNTPFLPDSKWRVHDGNRPQPTVISPGRWNLNQRKPPSDAIILFDGTDLSKWIGKGGQARWKVENGYMEVVKNTGDIQTNEPFGDCQLHIEWQTPAKIAGSGQGRGNSGVFLMGFYEIQVLDSYNNITYPDGQAGAIYGQSPPLVNACRPPGEWQSYDIIFQAPRFKEERLEKPAYITVIQNDVVIHHHQKIIGPTAHKKWTKYKPHGPAAIKLQDHGNPVRYRNIWIRPL
jgi:hypothetical protein